MEFFASANAHMTPTDLQRFIRIRNMPEWCTSIEKVSTQSGERGIMSWTKGDDAVHQEIIRN